MIHIVDGPRSIHPFNDQEMQVARSGSSSREKSSEGSRGLVIVGIIIALALIGALILGVQKTTSSSPKSESAGQSSSQASSDSHDDGDNSSGDDESDDDVSEQLARRTKGDPTAMGKKDAPVVMIEYADYRCPFCGVFARDTMPKIKKKYIDTGKVRFEWRDMTIYGDQSEQAALAARAAGEQGKYWQFHDALYDAAPKRGHPDLPRKKLLGFAKKAGVPDMGQFKKDMKSTKLKKKVKRDTEEGQNAGATATPTFLVGSKPVMGAQPWSQFEQTIDDALDEADG